MKQHSIKLIYSNYSQFLITEMNTLPCYNHEKLTWSWQM